MLNVLLSRAGKVFAIAALMLFLAGCLDDDLRTMEPQPVGYVSLYHASPDAPGLNIIVDNRQVNTMPFHYSDHSGYLNFYIGDRNLKFTSQNTAGALIDTLLSVKEDKAYSVFIIDRLASIEALLVRDSAASPAAGKAMVRFVHLSPDVASVDVKADDAAVALFGGATFKNPTAFKEVDAKTYTYNVFRAGTDDEVLSTQSVDLRAGGYYTILISGFDNPPAGNTNELKVDIL